MPLGRAFRMKSMHLVLVSSCWEHAVQLLASRSGNEPLPCSSSCFAGWEESCNCQHFTIACDIFAADFLLHDIHGIITSLDITNQWNTVGKPRQARQRAPPSTHECMSTRGSRRSFATDDDRQVKGRHHTAAVQQVPGLQNYTRRAYVYRHMNSVVYLARFEMVTHIRVLHALYATHYFCPIVGNSVGRKASIHARRTFFMMLMISAPTAAAPGRSMKCWLKLTMQLSCWCCVRRGGVSGTVVE